MIPGLRIPAYKAYFLSRILGMRTRSLASYFRMRGAHFILAMSIKIILCKQVFFICVVISIKMCISVSVLRVWSVNIFHVFHGLVTIGTRTHYRKNFTDQSQ